MKKMSYLSFLVLSGKLEKCRSSLAHVIQGVPIKVTEF